MAEPGTGTTQGNQSSKKNELPMERRLLLAFLLMGVVLFVTPYLFKSQQPQQKTETAPQETPAAVPTPPAPTAPAAQSEKPEEAITAMPGQVAAEADETFTIDTDLYTIVFSNRGAVVHSWILKQHKDSAGNPLQLVNPAAVGVVGYPFSVLFKEQNAPAAFNQALYVAKLAEDSLGIDFEWSDGNVLSRKSYHFQMDSYLWELSSEVIQEGRLVPHLMAWRGGFGDQAVPNPAGAQHALYFDSPDNKLRVNNVKDAKDGPVSASGAYSFAGLEDAYFVAVVLPDGDGPLELRTFSDTVMGAVNGKEEPRVGAAVGGAGVNRFSMFVGPKDVDLMRSVNPKLAQAVDFGWLSFIAKPLFYAVNYVNNSFVHNYGWAIVVVTIIINFLLLPLKFTSLRSMKRMQALQPQIAAINERYKGISLRDPKKAEQNQEVMGLYKKHGVNPMGGCMPMVLQIPFFIAFYKVLTVAIEMRGAEWLWVTDLSQPEHLPIRILPVTMIATQFIMQKMTPSTTGDPTQQKVMMLMPLVLGFMFYGVSSGLVLYWLTSNVVGIAQQWIINRTTPEVVVLPVAAKKKKGSKK